MKTVDFLSASALDCALSGITTIYQYPAWRHLEMPSRVMNGFLLIDKGQCTYSFDVPGAVPRRESLALTHGSLIYLPVGSRHEANADTDDLAYYRVNFTLTDMQDGETVRFSERPTVFTRDAGQTLFILAEQLERQTYAANAFARTQLLSAFLQQLLDGVRPETPEMQPVAAAVQYLNEHFTAETPVEELAAMCFMSPARFFRHFRAATGQTPVSYRNGLRLRAAQQLLLDRELTVAQISDMLGFANPSFFCRLFRAQYHCSPRRYAPPGP